MTRLCRKCNVEQPIDNFQINSTNKKPRWSCRSCETKARTARGYNPPSEEQKKKNSEKSSKHHKKMRRDPAKAAQIITRDSKNTDKKKGFANDLSSEFVGYMIKEGCSYCGTKSLKMTLDRIDNDIGHVIGNVTSSCYRCNMMRGNMPYEAWINIVPAIRDTIEKGLFGDWVGFGPWAKRHKEEIGG